MHEISIKLIYTTDISLKTNKKKRALRIFFCYLPISQHFSTEQRKVKAE